MKISDDSVIHLVAKSLEDNPNQIGQQTNQISQSLNNENLSSAVDDVYSSLIEIPMLRGTRRPRRRRLIHFDVSDCFESMHQNIISMNNVMNCKIKFDENQIANTRTITSFDFSKSKYEVGQWVDVRDTIDQWLEAQVLQVRNNQVYVHYNGWGAQWDEWIDFSSPRIANFKTYTLQSPTSIFLSPYPSVACDANIEPQHRNIDSFYYLEKTAVYMNELQKHIEYMIKLRKKNIISIYIIIKI